MEWLNVSRRLQRLRTGGGGLLSSAAGGQWLGTSLFHLYHLLIGSVLVLDVKIARSPVRIALQELFYPLKKRELDLQNVIFLSFSKVR